MFFGKISTGDVADYNPKSLSINWQDGMERGSPGQVRLCVCPHTASVVGFQWWP